MNTTQIGDGPVRFVFLHGLFGRGRNWTTIARALLPQTSLLVDLPNHGGSGWTDRFSYPEMARTVAELLAGLPEPPCLVGHSMGGRTAMLVAVTYPDLVSRLVIEDAAPVTQPMDEFVAYADAMARLPLDQIRNRAQARDWLRQSVPDERTMLFLLQNLQRDHDGGWHWTANLDVLRRDMAKVGVWDATDRVYDGPVLWITGEQSTQTNPGQTIQMKQHFPQLRHLSIAGAGHWVHADQPDAFIQVLRDFV